MGNGNPHNITQYYRYCTIFDTSIQNKISKHSIKLTEKFLEKNLNKEDHSEMINNSINELEKTLAHKNKFIQ